MLFIYKTDKPRDGTCMLLTYRTNKLMDGTDSVQIQKPRDGTYMLIFRTYNIKRA